MTRASVRAADVERVHAALRRMPVSQGHFEHILRITVRACCRLLAWHVDGGSRPVLPAVSGSRPGSGCVVACAPHRTWLEPFLLLDAWPADGARLVWLADGATVTRSWWRRRLLPAVGIIPIEGRLAGPGTYLEAAAAVLAAGAALVVFPEKGPPSEPDRLRPFSPGFAFLARRAGAPVIPVVVAGTHAVMRGSHFGVTFLAAIDTGAADPEPFAPGARPLAHALAERCAALIEADLPVRNAPTDEHRPARERWTWLAHLFR